MGFLAIDCWKTKQMEQLRKKKHKRSKQKKQNPNTFINDWDYKWYCPSTYIFTVRKNLNDT